MESFPLSGSEGAEVEQAGLLALPAGQGLGRMSSRVWAMLPCQPRRAQPADSSRPNWGQSGGMGSSAISSASRSTSSRTSRGTHASSRAWDSVPNLSPIGDTPKASSGTVGGSPVGPGPSRPSVAVAVKGDALDRQSAAGAGEVRRPVGLARGLELKKKRPRLRQRPQNGSDLLAKADD